ncbi:hypothetical protein MU582_01090 [Nocardioidaceae bacterium SCSIO 66511]|nr:hypothetical protein MU582_01090 [Nocardioidaceae bacterium SCSIO 66511]
MNKFTTLAVTLLASGAALGATTASSASAAELTSSTTNASSAQTTMSTAAQSVDTTGTSCTWVHAKRYIPDGEGSNAGWIGWVDYNQGGYDQDNVVIHDKMLDAQSASVLVKNNHTGATAYKHVYSGDVECLDVGNVPNGETVSWKACGWDNGAVQECRYGTFEE